MIFLTAELERKTMPYVKKGKALQREGLAEVGLSFAFSSVAEGGAMWG